MGVVGTNIIYSIGSVGGPAAAAQFAAVGAAVFLVAQKVEELTASSEKYQRMLKQVRTDMSAYNTETKGLIDTQAGLEGVVKLQNAGLTATREQLAAVGKAAIQMNQSLGGGPKGATTQFEKLIQSVVKGNERALVPFGIQLDETEDKAAAAAEALAKFEAKFGNVSVEVETTREAVFALENNLGTLTDQTIASLGSQDLFVDAINDTNTVLAEMTAIYEATGGAVDTFDLAIQGLTIDIFKLTEALFGANEGVATLLSQRLALNIETQKVAESERQLQEQQDAAVEQALLQSAIPGKKKRGGGGKKPTQEMVFTIEELEFFEQTGSTIEELFRENPIVIGARVAPSIQEIEELTGGQTLTELQIQEQLELIEHSKKTKEELWILELEQEERNRQLEMERQMFRDEALGIEKARRISHMEEMLGIEQAGVDQSFEIWQSGLQGRLSLFSQFFGQLALLQNTQSKALFNVGKAAAIGQSVVDTFLAAQKSYQAMAGIPYVGPILGVAAAASAIAFGVANTRKIAKVKYGQKTAPAGGAPSLGGAPSSTAIPSGPLGGEGQGGGGTTVVQLNLDGQPIHEAIISANDNAVQQGRPGFSQA
jgi:hypothetical protein